MGQGVHNSMYTVLATRAAMDMGVSTDRDGAGVRHRHVHCGAMPTADSDQEQHHHSAAPEAPGVRCS